MEGVSGDESAIVFGSGSYVAVGPMLILGGMVLGVRQPEYAVYLYWIVAVLPPVWCSFSHFREFDASARALRMMDEFGILQSETKVRGRC
jgi:Zn-dependent membrane protease YugP